MFVFAIVAEFANNFACVTLQLLLRHLFIAKDVYKVQKKQSRKQQHQQAENNYIMAGVSQRCSLRNSTYVSSIYG